MSKVLKKNLSHIVLHVVLNLAAHMAVVNDFVRSRHTQLGCMMGQILDQ